MPTEAEWAWLAGIIDGEGSIGAYAAYRRLGPSARVVKGHTVCIQVVNTDLGIIEKAARICGGSYSIVKRKVRPTRYRPDYALVIRARQDVLRVLESTAPFLAGYKKERARLAIEYLKLRLKHGASRKPLLTPHEHSLVEAIKAVHQEG